MVYRPWGHKESDVTEHTHTHIYTHIYILFRIFPLWFIDEQDEHSSPCDVAGACC